MKTLTWDSGVSWDDPNARWGDPSYVLEPGDPGYINTGLAPGSQKSKTKSTTMSASNETPRNQKILLAVSRQIIAGMTVLQDTIDLHHHRDTTLGPAMKKLAGDSAAGFGTNANKGSQLVFKELDGSLDAANAAVVALSDGEVKTWLTGYRKVIEGLHGKSLNAGWQAAGFTFEGTQVPRSHDDRQTLLETARAYLAAHPTYEVNLPQLSGPPLAITAAKALALNTDMTTARTVVNTKSAEQELAKNLRDGDYQALYKEVSDTIGELHDQLEDDDPRWEQFGLNIPANPNPPERATGLTLTSAGPGRETAEWQHARRATRYRIFLKIAGVDTEFKSVGSAEDLDFTLKGLTPGATISVYIIAANDAGEADASEIATKVVGT